MTLTATVTIVPIGQQIAGVPFTVAGTYQLNSATWTANLEYVDNGGNANPVAAPTINLGVSSFNFTHPGLPVGTHTVSVKDPLTGTLVTSNSFVVSGSQTITPVVPTGVVAGTPFTLIGTMTGYASAPALTYRLDGGAAVTIPTVTSTSFSVLITVTTAGTHTLIVIDGAASSNTITFSVAPASASHVITPAAPTGVVAGQTFTFTGSLTGYSTPPALTYQVNAGTKVSMTGVTSTSWSMVITAPSTTGSSTIVVSDGTTTGSVQFTVSATPRTITPYAPNNPQVGSVFTFTGVLNGYTTIPALTYQINAGAKIGMTGVSVSGWSMAITAPANVGSYTITVSDGTVSSAAIAFATVAAAGPTRRYQDQPGGSNNVWNTPIGSGATHGAPTDADTIDARNGGFINSVDNYGAVVWDATPSTNNTLVHFTGHGADYANTAYPNNSGTPYDVTANCIIGSYSPGPYPGDGQYSFIDEINYPGQYLQFGPLSISNLQPGIGTQAAYFGGMEDAMSDTFCQDWETGHANSAQAAGLIRAYDLDPARNPTLIPIATLQGYDPTQPSTAKITRINHVFRYAHDAKYLKSNTDPNTTRNPTYPNGFLLPTSWPELYQDYQNGINVYTGNLVYGTQLFIPAGTAFPTALRGNVAAIQIFDALINFGSISRDQAGGGYHLYADQNVAQSWIDSANAALPTIVQLLVPMRNQHQGGQSFTTNPANGPGTRLVPLPPPLAPLNGGTPSSTSPVTWSKTDVAGGTTVGTSGYVATSGGTTTAGSTPQGVRATTAISTSAVVAWEVAMGALTQNWAAGIADATYALTSGGGIGSDVHAIGAYPSTGTGSQPPQTVYFNNNQLTAGNGVADVAGDVMSLVANGTNLFFSTPSMRTTSGVTWNNSTTANPITNVGGLSFAGLGSPYYPVWSEGESGGSATLNDGTSAFSAFMTLFLNQNPTVKTLSGQVTSSSNVIGPAAPPNATAGAPFTFTGTLAGYTTAPSLTYRINTGAATALSGVTATGWSTTLTISSSGTDTITVTDGTVSGSITFTVGAAGSTGGATRVPAPLTGTVTTGAWTAVDLAVPGVTLASGKAFHFEILPPAQYNAKYVYPVTLWLHPDQEGNAWYDGSNTNPNYLSGYDADGWFNTVSFRTRYPGFIVVCYADQTTASSEIQNFGGWVNNGQTGSGAVYSGDTGPNVFAIVNGVIPYMIKNYSVDATRVYSTGFSLGAIGTEYLLLKYNAVNGLQKLFAAGVSCGGGVLEINGYGTGPSKADITASQAPPIWNVSGVNDTTSYPTHWNLPIWQGITGNTNYPSSITSAAASRAGTSNYYLSYLPNVGHQPTDASGNPFATNTVLMDWLFAQSATAAITITGATFTPAASIVANSAVGTLAGTLSGVANTGNSLTGLTYTLSSTSQFKVSGAQVLFNSATVGAGTYSLNVTVSASNATNSPQTYPITVSVTSVAQPGAFTVTGGQVIAPDGTQFIARGINVSDGDMSSVITNTTTGAPLTTLFPGVNFIRLACYDLTQRASYYDAFITAATNLKIVVEIEDHTTSTGSNSGGASGVVFTSTLLTNELAWYSALAASYKNNPYVWFGTNNEPAYSPSISALSTWHQQTYNAIRNAGASNILMVCLPGGGNPGTYGTGNGLTASVYAAMTGVVWDFHQYAWAYNDGNGNNGQSGPNAIAVSYMTNAQRTNIATVQTITSHDGTMPVICGEFGISTDGSTLDVSGNAMVSATQANCVATAAGSAVAPLAAYFGNIDAGASGTPNTIGYYPGFSTQWDGFVSVIGRRPTSYLCYYDQSQSSTGTNGWANYTNYLTGIFAGNTRTANVTPIVGWPFGTTPEGNLFTSISNGSRDTEIQNALANWKTGGCPTLYIRPAWEFNLPNTYGVTTANVSAFIAAWKHFYTTVHSYASANGMTVKVIWNPNVGANQVSGGTTLTVAQQYPGDAYVDVYGIDTYGNPVDGSHNNVAATTTDNTQYLVTTMVAMAKASGKTICFPEIGGTDTTFATNMVNYLTSLSPNTAPSIEFFGMWDIDDGSGNLSWTNSWDNQAALQTAWKNGFGTTGTVTNKVTSPGAFFGSAAWHWGQIDAYNNLTTNEAGTALTTYGKSIAKFY